MPVDSLNQTAEGIPDSNPKECALDRPPIPEFGKDRSLPSGIQLLRFDPRCSRFHSVLRGTLPTDPPPFAANQNGDIRRLEWLAAALARQRLAAAPPLSVMNSRRFV